MITDFLFIAFFFIAHKQLYTATHYTGESRLIALLIKYVGILGIISEVAYLIWFSTQSSFLRALLLVVVTLMVTVAINRIVTNRIILKMEREGWDVKNDPEDPETKKFLEVCLKRCDVAATYVSTAGLVINPLIALTFFLIF